MSPLVNWPLDRNRIRRGMKNHTFGMVRRNADGSIRPHQGWDFAAAIGTQCFAVAAGEIMGVSNGGAYGRQVVLRFQVDIDGNGKPDTLYAFYAHLSQADVVPGQVVKRGQQLGLTGDSGNARGMKPVDQHLHFELRTAPWPTTGLSGRISPLELFGHCPLQGPVYRVEQAA